ncbi:hypothetical protein FGO68_gene16094 [Halteria grandinella]|uniref:Uncharacterized protein n=1 Tax=Halteria grandinella TaxID=5974 RepID=A0A8J8NCZ1_HALGN|nr:hypothetical protein FGO68_gene16094 [Halteria grandinella]
MNILQTCCDCHVCRNDRQGSQILIPRELLVSFERSNLSYCLKQIEAFSQPNLDQIKEQSTNQTNNVLLQAQNQSNEGPQKLNFIKNHPKMSPPFLNGDKQLHNYYQVISNGKISKRPLTYMLQYQKDQALNPFDQVLLQIQKAPIIQNPNAHLIRGDIFSTKYLYGRPENIEQLQESNVIEQDSRISFGKIKESQLSLNQTSSKFMPSKLNVNSAKQFNCEKQYCSAEQDRIQNQFEYIHLGKDNCTVRPQKQPQTTQLGFQDQVHRKTTYVNLQENQNYLTFANAKCIQSSINFEQIAGIGMESDNSPRLTASSNFQISKQDDLICYESEIIDPSLNYLDQSSLNINPSRQRIIFPILEK